MSGTTTNPIGQWCNVFLTDAAMATVGSSNTCLKINVFGRVKGNRASHQVPPKQVDGIKRIEDGKEPAQEDTKAQDGTVCMLGHHLCSNFEPQTQAKISNQQMQDQSSR